MVSKRPQFYVRTKSHEWQWDVSEDIKGTSCKEVGIISHHDFKERQQAIESGEWKVKNYEPKCWFWARKEDV
jgi:hypothetical protein